MYIYNKTKQKKNKIKKMKKSELIKIIKEELIKTLGQSKLTSNSKDLSEAPQRPENEDYYGNNGPWEKYYKRSGITGIIDELVKDFNLEFQIHYSKELAVTPPSSRTWTRSDGHRYKEPGIITGPDANKFWEWLQNKPNVKQIGKVGGSFQSDLKMDSIQYKNIYLSKRSSDSIIFGAISRLKSGRGAWGTE